MQRRFYLTLFCLLLAALLLPAAAQALTFDQAIDQLVEQGYPQQVERQLISYGTSALGMRMGATSADNAAARYIADEMNRLGMANVRLEKVAVDKWEWRGAWVTVNGKKLTATSFGGVPPTPFGGLNGELVYAGLGSAPDYEELGDVTGKIVIVDFASDYFWINLPGLEAKVRGAKAVVMTYNPLFPYYYGIAPDALGTNDGSYDANACPMVYVCQNDGDWLKSLVEAGLTTATVVNDVIYKSADDGAYGYNVYGEVPGSVKNGEKVVYGSHHDAYFRMGLDDTSGVVANLMMVKAMKMSGFKPARTVALFASTSEEWAYQNCYYDWLGGAWQGITKTHPDWPGKVVGFVENELLGYKDGSLWMTATPELKPFLEATVAANRKIVETGGQYDPDLSGKVFNPRDDVWFTYNDQWPMTAKGIPSVCLWSTGDAFWPRIYHTNYENESLVDYAFLGNNTKFIFRIGQALDKGLLPYSLEARADDLAATVSGSALTGAGCSPAAVSRFTTAVAAFQQAAGAYQARKASVSASRWPAVNRELLGIEVDANKAFTGLGAWDETFYPHQQTLADTQYLNAAIRALSQPNPQTAQAFKALDLVGATWYGEYFSYSVYRRELARRAPDYPRLSWAAAGHIPRFVDVMPEWRQIEAGEYADAIDGLEAERDAELTDLGARIAALSATLENLTPRIEALR